MIRYIIVFFLVTGLNVVPVFMPATWTILTFLSLTYNIPFLPISIIGAIAATVGRILLAKGSRAIIRQRFLSHKTQKNVDQIKKYVEQRTEIAFLVFLSYAFSPLPSNQLFIAYGLTDLKIWYLAVPFFIGRLVSYLALTFSANKAVAYFPESWASLLGPYFILSQLFTIFVVYLFTKINWRSLIRRKRVELMK